MRSNVNYHIHTTYSDGGKTVAEVVAGLKDAGVEYFSITDHDCVKGNAEAARLAKKYGLKHTNGVELSCCFDGEIGFDATYVCHILGFDVRLKETQSEIDKITAAKDEKMSGLFNALVGDGYKLDAANVYDGGRIKKRKAVARELISKGYASDADEAFEKILNSDKYRAFAKNPPTIKEGIALIKKCGGVAAWAHPFGITRGGKKELTRGQVTELSESMDAYGIDAVEVYYRQYAAEQIRFLENLTDGMKRLKTAGTDYHANAALNRSGRCEQLYFDADGLDCPITVWHA